MPLSTLIQKIRKSSSRHTRSLKKKCWISQKHSCQRRKSRAHIFGLTEVRIISRTLTAFIAFGTPTINKASVLDQGMLLFENEEEREEWFLRLGHSDLVQTVHRIRPIKGGKTIIIIGREWPEQLPPPSIHIDLRRGESKQFRKAYERLEGFVKEHGFITKEIAYYRGIGCKRELDILTTFQWRLKAELNSLKERDPSQNDVPFLIKSIILEKEHHLIPPPPISPQSTGFWPPIILADTSGNAQEEIP